MTGRKQIKTVIKTPSKVIKQILPAETLFKKFSFEYGSNFELRNLRRMIQFANELSNKKIVSTMSTQLSWSYNDTRDCHPTGNEKLATLLRESAKIVVTLSRQLISATVRKHWTVQMPEATIKKYLIVQPDSVIKKNLITARDGKNYDTNHYSLQMRKSHEQ